jgi:putative ABC transport system permease protein
MPTLADRLYRGLLLALPSDLRREFGDDMVQLFRDHRRAVGARPMRQAGLWFEAARDVFSQAADARRRPADRFAVTPMRYPMSALVTDLRQSFRLLRRYPSLSVVDAVLWRSLPYPDPQQLMMVWEKRPTEGVLTNPASAADYLDWRARNTVFSHTAAYLNTNVTLTGNGEPAEVDAGIVSWEFFDVLGVRPAIGRSFQARDEEFGQGRVVILTHRIWTTRFSRDPQVIGRTIMINSTPWTVIGVLPADFAFVDASNDFWAPLGLTGPGAPPSRVSHNFQVYARLKDGVNYAQALDAMDRLGRDLEAQYPDQNRGHGAYVTPMQEHYVQPIRASLILLAAGVGLVLLIACVNVASLMLARAASRHREMAVRSAIGASRARLAAQMLVESLMLAGLGGLAGLGVAYAVLQALPIVMPDRLSIVGLEDLSIDPRMLIFAAALTIATGLLFGIWPAIHASKPALSGVLNTGGRGPAGIRRRVRQALVVAEVAVASLALVGAGLVLRSFSNLTARPLGFTPEQRLSVMVSAPRARYPSAEAQRDLLSRMEKQLAAVPGVKAVGAVNLLPLTAFDSRTGVGIEGREPVPDEPPVRMHPRVVTPSYFQTMEIPILKGRGFTSADILGAEPVVIINETSAKRFLPGQDPIGRRIRFGGDDVWRTVVGVAGDVRHWGLLRPVNPTIYWPHAQANAPFLFFVMRTDRDPESAMPDVKSAIAAVDQQIPAMLMRTMTTVVSESVRAERASTVLMSTFGVLALVLAVIGIYGVMAQLVTERVHEIGVRMTLGARPRDVLARLLGEGLWQTAIGLTIGLTAGALLMRLGESLLIEVAPWDPRTLAAVAAILVLAAMAACWIPARRAMRVDPVRALRGA